MDLERKGQQSYQGDLYVRFIDLGNGVQQSLYDRSVGFFRRQIILSTKEKDPNRKDDPYIAERMYAAYKLWCDDNALTSLSKKSFCSFLKQNESRYNLEYTNK